MKPINADAQLPDDREEVLELLNRRVEVSQVKDIERLMSFYSPDIVYFDVVLPHHFTGADEVRRNFLRWFAEYEGDISLKTHELKVVVSGDVAFAHMLHRDSGVRRSGQDLVIWVRSTVCLERTDGRWSITHEHISFPIDPEAWGAVVDAAP